MTRSHVVLPANGGWWSVNDESAIPPNAWADLKNFSIGANGCPVARPGFEDYNTSAFTISGGSGTAAVFLAIKEFPRFSGSTETKKLVAIVQDTTGTAIVKDDLDATWDVIQAHGWSSTPDRAHITIAEGYAVFSDGAATPKKWDQTSVTDLGSSAPLFIASTYHLKRLFMITGAGAVSYTASGDITDHTGTDTGTLPFDLGTGDRIIGVSEPFRDDIYFFQGPNIGGVHRLSGGTPATFARRKVANGAPCAGHGAIVTTETDVFWAGRQGVHSLQAMLSGGDSCISRPIQYEWIRHFRSYLGTPPSGWHDPENQYVAWTVGNRAFVYSYAYKLWSYWTLPATVFSCIARPFRPSNLDTTQYMYFGLAAGWTIYQNEQSYVDDALGAADAVISLSAKTPQIYKLDNKPPHQEVQFVRATVFAKDADRPNDSDPETVTGGEQFSLGFSAASSTAINVVEPFTVREAPATLGIHGMECAKTTIEGRDTWAQLTFDNTDFTTSTTVRPMIAGYAIDFVPAEILASETA